MKKTVLYLILIELSFVINTYAQCDFSLQTFPNGAYIRQVTDYGATPNDSSDNDFYAIAKAINDVQSFINNHTGYYGIVQFPDGQYDVGEQITGDMKLFDPHSIHPEDTTYFKADGYFKDLRNIIITGTNSCNKAIIKYKNGFTFGYNATNPINIASVFKMYEIANVRFSDLELDGNNYNFVYSGYPAPTGAYEPSHIGISVYRYTANLSSISECVELKNMFIHSFCSDGADIQFSTEDSSQYNGIIERSTISNCGRQNLTLPQGNNVHIKNSDFIYAGKFYLPNYDLNQYDTATQNPYTLSPNNNIDIEVETGSSRIIKNITFDSCRINYDAFGKGSSLNIAGGAQSDNFYNIAFNNCELRGHAGSIEMEYTSHKAFHFNNCTFEGIIYMTGSAGTGLSNTPLYANEITEFNSCIFYPYKNATLTPFSQFNGTALVFSRGQNLFEHCRFYTNINPLYVNQSLGLGAQMMQYDSFANCAFYYDYTYNSQYSLPKSNFRDCFFIKDNSFNITDSCVAQTANKNRDENTNDVIIAGNTDALHPYNLNYISGFRTYASYTNGANVVYGEYPCEYLNVNIGDGISSGIVATVANSFTSGTPGANFYINKNTTIIVKKGGNLILGSNIYLAGKIIVQSGGSIQYMADNNLYYSNALTAPDITINTGSIVTGTPNGIDTNEANLQPPASILLTTDPCTGGTAAKKQYEITNKPIASDFDVKLTPNPANTNFKITFNKAPRTFTIKMTSVEGKTLLVRKASGMTATIDISAFAPGAYFVEVSDKIHKSVQRLIKE